ncbi:hypothetical protein PtB15_13B314 [Puccinia triticina]|nr:hypothetical protein PtB15_13B314 [Puccinia triticina]
MQNRQPHNCPVVDYQNHRQGKPLPTLLTQRTSIPYCFHDLATRHSPGAATVTAFPFAKARMRYKEDRHPTIPEPLKDEFLLDLLAPVEACFHANPGGSTQPIPRQSLFFSIIIHQAPQPTRPCQQCTKLIGPSWPPARSRLPFSVVTLAVQDPVGVFFILALPLIFWLSDHHFERSPVYILGMSVYFTGILKDLFCIPRPYLLPIQRLAISNRASEYGFPSSHSAISASMFLMGLQYALHVQLIVQQLTLFLGLILYGFLLTNGQDCESGRVGLPVCIVVSAIA